MTNSSSSVNKGTGGKNLDPVRTEPQQLARDGKTPVGGVTLKDFGIHLTRKET